LSRNSEQAVALFSEGFNCAQAVLTACGEPRGLPRNIALRVAGPFGAGVGRMCGTCGAVSGAYMAIGLKYAKTGPGEDTAREKGYELACEFTARFNRRHQSTICSELLGCEIATPEGKQQAKEQKLFTTRCPVFVRDAAEIVDELLAQSQETSATGS
jgi:C_GCAxxG_C_C family probable redox protein